ncbi:response regulator transcription factor [Hoeflea sp. TYP-13]|uniref:response regulator transcription factor n=1 Tax=Hoeflea sp. TYP-13 TaxID=3230023 RepID=UPI0034C5F095
MSLVSETYGGLSMELHQRAVVFVGPHHNFAECIETALKHEIGGLDVVRYSDFKLLFEDIDNVRHRADLVIIDETMCAQAPSHLVQLRDCFPSQVFCVAFNKPDLLTGYIHDSGLQGVIQSFLPMNMRLDIWLSAVQLMINGGEYIPPQFLAASQAGHNGADTNGATQTKENGSQKRQQTQAASSADKLTAREIDVLKLVAKGYQNKLIAAELELSEHTIKLHMHHIIAKMGVSNRTEAAAIYLDKIDLREAKAAGTV